jgi:glycosyltransferase involved in cell wall biosynthesis
LKEEKYRDWNSFFSFDGMVNRMREVFQVDPKIGVVTIALNEDKFIKASLQSVIKHPSVKKVVVIEGAVKLFSHAASEIGLSVDNTQEAIAEVMRGPQGHKILYERYLWAEDKSELRNRALELLPKDITHVLVVDGDEVWKPEDLDKLVQTMRENPNAGMFSFNFLHFWKKKNLIATGGQWNSHLFRCFKYTDKSLHWKNHGAPVVNAEGKSIDETDGAVLVKGIYVYHYGAMKEEKRIIEKLEFYKKRDTKLDVKNTWSKWKPGQETQWTHGNGTAEEFRGTHPEELKGII